MNFWHWTLNKQQSANLYLTFTFPYGPVKMMSTTTLYRKWFIYPIEYVVNIVKTVLTYTFFKCVDIYISFQILIWWYLFINCCILSSLDRRYDHSKGWLMIVVCFTACDKYFIPITNENKLTILIHTNTVSVWWTMCRKRETQITKGWLFNPFWLDVAVYCILIDWVWVE